MREVIDFLRGLFPAEFHDRVFLVGGIVRDYISGKESKDIDLVAAVPPELPALLKFRLVQSKSAVPIWFRYHKEFGKLEVTLLNDLSELDGDLTRRDFTINALAMALSDEIVDPLGGRADIANKSLRICNAASFEDDPIRIFRAFRFESEGFRMTSETEKLITGKKWSESFAKIPVERFSREMIKALEKPDPARFFYRMSEMGVGREFLPELFRMRDIPAGPIEYHPEGDLLTHSLQVLERSAAVSDDPLARFCVMFHDLGKLATDLELHPKHHGHEEAGAEAAVSFCNLLKLPVVYRRALTWICRLHGSAGKWKELRDSKRIYLAEKAMQSGISDILPIVAAADKPGAVMSDWGEALRIVSLTMLELGLSQEQLEKLQPADRPALIMQKRLERLRLNRETGQT